MAVGKRLEMERESFLEDIDLFGVIVIEKKKFVRIGGGKNMSKSVQEAWLESWRDYKEDDKVTLQFIITHADLMAIWNPQGVWAEPAEL